MPQLIGTYLVLVALIVLSAGCGPPGAPAEHTAARPPASPTAPLRPTPTPVGCGQPAGAAAPALHYEFGTDQPVEEMMAQISHYLTVTGSTKGLAPAIEAAGAERLPIRAQVIPADVTGDGQVDILTQVSLVWGGTYTWLLSLFGCREEGYTELDRMEGGGFYSGQPATIEVVHDLNQDGRPEIVFRQPTVEGTKGFDSLIIYGWQGTGFRPDFTLGPLYGRFEPVTVEEGDNAGPPRLAIGYFYAYEAESATAFIEFSRVRPITMLYRWNGRNYIRLCQYFTDEPTLRLALLHSAEAFRGCGFYERAAQAYQRLLTDKTLVPWSDGLNTPPPLVYPERLDSPDEQKRYAAEVERAYLAAFAGYRLVQLALQAEQPVEAQARLARLQVDYQPGQHGYLYAAMAAAYLDQYEVDSTEAACRAAADTLARVRAGPPDPGLAYLAEPAIDHGFYFSGTQLYGSNPDNLFVVPAEIDRMVHIPVCLEPESPGEEE